MKIVMVNKFHYRKGGSETYYFTIADALRKKGHEVVFFAMESSKNIVREDDKCYFIPEVSFDGGIKEKLKAIKSIFYSKTSYLAMIELIEKEKPDVAILNLVHKQISCSIIDALKKYNVKIVWIMHDLITICPSYTMINGRGDICNKCLTQGFNSCIKNKCIRNSKLMSYLAAKEAKYIKRKGWYNDVDLFVCPSLFYKDLLEKSNFTKSKIIHIFNPLSEHFFDNFHICFGDYALYFGRLSHEKGIDTLISSAKINSSINYVIAGTGPKKDELMSEASNAKNVKFIGFVEGDELIRTIRNARVIVIPSEWYENNPYSALESLALGKPIIVSDLGGLPELIDCDRNGYCFKSGDSKDLSSKIKEVFDLPKESYTRLCLSCNGFAKKHFDSNVYVEELIKEINKL